jgi:hypothetical protein
MSRSDSFATKTLPPIQRYGLAAGSVAISLGLALLLERYGFRGLADPLFF